MTQTFQDECNEVSACFRRFLAKKCECQLQQRCLLELTFDHSSMSSSPTVVSTITRPFVGRDMTAEVARDATPQSPHVFTFHLVLFQHSPSLIVIVYSVLGLDPHLLVSYGPCTTFCPSTCQSASYGGHRTPQRRQPAERGHQQAVYQEPPYDSIYGPRPQNLHEAWLASEQPHVHAHAWVRVRTTRTRASRRKQ
jgi:hypothetical protein